MKIYTCIPICKGERERVLEGGNLPKSILLDDNNHEFKLLDEGSSLKLPGAIDQWQYMLDLL